MGTRNNPSPGGPRGGLETPPKRTRTRKQPVRASKPKPEPDVLDSTEEVTTMTQSQAQPHQEPNPFTFEQSTSAPTTRYNTRSSRSVSPSLLNQEANGRTHDPKGKGVSRPRASSRSGSSTHQGFEPSSARGGKRKAAKDISEAHDAGEGPTAKRPRTTRSQTPENTQPLNSRKRTRRNPIPDSPIIEAVEEQEARKDRAAEHHRHDGAEDQQHISEHRIAIPQPSSTTTRSQVQTPAQAEPSQRDDTKSGLYEIAEERAIVGTSIPSRSQQPVIERNDIQGSGAKFDAQDVSQQRPAPRNRSKRTAPLPTLKHPHTHKQQNHSDGYLSDENDEFDETLVLPSAYRSQEATRAVAQTKTSLVAHSKAEQSQPRRVREIATLKNVLVTGQGLSDARVAQGSAQDYSKNIPDDPIEREAYLQKRFGKHRTKVLQPHTKAVLSMGPVEIYDESEHEEDIENPFTRDEFQEWKQDLKVAKKVYHSILGGERLPSPEPSSKAKEKQITRRKLGETPPASRPSTNILNSKFLMFPRSSSQEQLVVTDPNLIDKLYALVEWEQSSEANSLPSKERLIGLLETAKSEEMTGARPSAPSPNPQRTTSQPASAKSIRRNERLHSPQDNESGVVGVRPSGHEPSTHHGEIKHPAEDVESDMMGDKPSDDEPEDDDMSESQSEVDDNEAAPTTPIQSPSQRVSESRAWSVFAKVKNAVASPFKFLGLHQNSGSAAATNDTKTEFTFTHPHELSQPLITPTRSSKQRFKPQSERRDTTNSHRVSRSSRAPQTERLRRHVDKPQPLHLRGAPSASDMNSLYIQQAATRRRKRESEIASLEQEEPSHGKSFRVPDSDDSDDDDGDNQDQAPEDAEMVNSAPKKWAFLVQNKPVLEEPVQAADPEHQPKPWDGDDWSWVKPSLSPEEKLASDQRMMEANKREMEARNPGLWRGNAMWDKDDGVLSVAGQKAMSNAGDQQIESSGSSSKEPQYIWVTIPELNHRYYRRINPDNEHDIALNIFGEPTYFIKMKDQSYRKIDKPWDPMKGHTQWSVRGFEAQHKAGEKKAIEKKWARLEEERRQRGTTMRPKPYTPEWWRLHRLGKDTAVEDIYRDFASGDISSKPVADSTSRTQEIDKEAAQPSEDSIEGSAVGYISAKPVAESTSRTQEIDKEAAQPSTDSIKGSAVKDTSIGYYTSTLLQIEEEDREAREAAQSSADSIKGLAEENSLARSVQETGSNLQQKQWNQTPPPKPRPSNAQLPQPTAAELALANVNKYQPKKPSGLRNVTQMSPLQMEQENRAQEAEQLKEVDEALAKITDFPDVWLPKPIRMEYDLPEGYSQTFREFSDEIEDAVTAAWNRVHGIQ